MSDALSDNSKSLLKADKAIADLGLPLPSRPNGEPSDVVWPDNIADLSSDELGHQMTWWSGWSSYARYHLARAETNEENFDAELRLALDEWMVNSRGDYGTVTEGKAHFAKRTESIKLKQKIQNARALIKMIKSILKGYEDKYATASREISRRHGEFVESGGGSEGHHEVTPSGKDRFRAG